MSSVTRRRSGPAFAKARIARRSPLFLALPICLGLPLLVAGGCGDGTPGLVGPEEARSTATVRAARRAYDGAPPVIPHENFGMTCSECHNLRGMEVPGTGYAPPSPHAKTMGLSDVSRCRQCHVFSRTDGVFVASEFVPLRQDLRRGERLSAVSPPRIPHRVFMRENCSACHTGPAAREPIRTTHPERARCRQCHVPVETREEFDSRFGDKLVPGERGSDGSAARDAGEASGSAEAEAGATTRGGEEGGRPR